MEPLSSDAGSAENIPQYSIRNHPIQGFRNQAHFLDYLFKDGQIRTGTLVAINAEKL